MLRINLAYEIGIIMFYSKALCRALNQIFVWVIMFPKLFYVHVVRNITDREDLGPPK